MCFLKQNFKNKVMQRKNKDIFLLSPGKFGWQATASFLVDLC
jgi:hypothetical protein